MNLKYIIEKFKTYVKSYLAYRGQTKNKNKGTHDKAIIVQISDSRIYNRYFYTFIKFFSLAGYEIYFPDVDFTYYRHNIYNKKSNLYRLLFDEKFLIYNKPPIKSKVVLHIKDEHLSPDYFSSFISNQSAQQSFYIPMTMHPLFYYKGFWNERLTYKKSKKKSIFMIGCFDETSYSKIKKTPFKIESRTDTYQYLKQNKCLKHIHSIDELNAYIASASDLECILMDSDTTPITIQNLRSTIGKFYFYLALPGVFMPCSHNLIEALSTGAIPIIHANYAHLMKPKLKHMHDAIFYKDLQDLQVQINKAYQIKNDVLNTMRKNVFTYYINNLTPIAVTHKMISHQYDVLYLQAEYLSVKMYKEHIIS
ncbi:MAG: hypothetical protein ACI8RP_000115 [Urechidicola sp.]|jgi:hypothetical protein